MAYINDETETEKLINKLVNQNELNAKFDIETRTILFDVETNSKYLNNEELKKSLSDCIELSALIHSFDDMLRMAPIYIQKINRINGNFGIVNPLSSMASSSGFIMDDEGASLSPPS